MQTALQAVADGQIDQEKIQSKQEHGNNDYRRRSLDFLQRRRRDFLHLRTHVVVKGPDPIRPGSERVPYRVLFDRCRHTFPLSSTAPSRASTLTINSGRGGGIRTPKFGFGDRQFNR
jgi:hypothetical protein